MANCSGCPCSDCEVNQQQVIKVIQKGYDLLDRVIKSCQEHYNSFTTSLAIKNVVFYMEPNYLPGLKDDILGMKKDGDEITETLENLKTKSEKKGSNKYNFLSAEEIEAIREYKNVKAERDSRPAISLFNYQNLLNNQKPTDLPANWKQQIADKQQYSETIKKLQQRIIDLEKSLDDKETIFDIFGSNTIEQWIKKWKENPTLVGLLISNVDKLFPYLKKNSENYKEKYTHKELNDIFDKLKRQIQKEIEIEEGDDPQKLQEKIKSLKEERKKYLPDEEGVTDTWKVNKEKQLTQEIDRLERKLESIRQAEKVAEIRKTPRSINNWFKVFQITQPQLDKLHKLVELGIIDIDFDNTLYAWKEVEEMLKKPLPLKKQTIYSWWIAKGISDEEYFLLKKKGVDVDNQELTQKEVWELVDKYNDEPSTPKKNKLLKIDMMKEWLVERNTNF